MNAVKELMLARPRLTLAVAESATSGRLQAAIGAISGASRFFLGGITAYTIDQKVRHLGVDRAVAEAVDCVSAGVAEQMAEGACRMFRADVGIATTGYAEPARRGAVPFVWWAIALRKGAGRFPVVSGRVAFPGASRTEVQELAAAAALDALESFLADLPRSQRIPRRPNRGPLKVRSGRYS
jgi:nicotinamide-nucleotide amidase